MIELERFLDPDPKVGLIAEVQQRLLVAQSVREQTNTNQDSQWAEVGIVPQSGLVPIGRDSLSGLWEFVHIQTGTAPSRDESGKLLVTGETGLVLVLVPGGKFFMGAQNDDPKGQNYTPQAKDDEAPVHTISLAPFFLSKYEMTQAQWERATGENPSQLAQEGEVHPVETISWQDCVKSLRAVGLELPTEAQWEYVSRASKTPIWTESDGSSHAAIGTSEPNSFGLHELYGNVAEWCRDFRSPYSKPIRIGDGLRAAPTIHPLRHRWTQFRPRHHRVARGASFLDTIAYARHASRTFHYSGFRDYNLGVRPSRTLIQ